MDPETVYETMFEILGSDEYRVEAEEIFTKEILNCNEMSEADKRDLIDSLTSFKGEINSKHDPRIERIVELLTRSPTLQDYFAMQLKAKTDEHNI